MKHSLAPHLLLTFRSPPQAHPEASRASRALTTPFLTGAAAIMLGLCAFPTAAGAQIVNVLSQLSERDTEGVSGSVTGTFMAKRGNTFVTQGNGSLVVGYKHGPHTVYTLASADYGEDRTDPFISKTFEHMRYRRALLSWLDVESFFQHEYDRFRRLRLRALAGAGVRIATKPWRSLSVAWGGAYMPEYELLTAGAGQVSSQHVQVVHRASTYLQVALKLDKQFTMRTTSFVQPRINKPSDFRVLSESALTVNANSWLSLSVAYTFAYDSRPPTDVNERDTSLVTAITVRW